MADLTSLMVKFGIDPEEIKSIPTNKLYYTKRMMEPAAEIISVARQLISDGEKEIIPVAS